MRNQIESMINTNNICPPANKFYKHSFIDILNKKLPVGLNDILWCLTQLKLVINNG